MPARHRERNVEDGKGGSSYYYLANPQHQLRVVEEGLIQSMDDHVGNFPRPNPMSLSKIETWHPVLNGRLLGGSGTLLREFEAFPIDYYPAPSDPRESFPVLDEVDRSNIGWDLLAKTNVSKAHVDVPSFIGEGVEGAFALGWLTLEQTKVARANPLSAIPALIMQSIRRALTGAAAYHLADRWAFRPFVRDVRSMLSFVEACDKRYQVLTNLLTDKSVKRKAGLGNGSNIVSDEEVFLHSSNGAIIKARRIVTHTYTMWGSVKWKLVGDGGIPFLAPERKKFVGRLLAGLNRSGDLAALWELTPWSWFIDWFAGLGTVVQATNNTVQMTWSENCLMRKSRSDTRFELIDGSWQDWCSISGMPLEIHERKERYLCAPVLPFIPSWQPLVEPKAWSILAALTVLKKVRSR